MDIKKVVTWLGAALVAFLLVTGKVTVGVNENAPQSAVVAPAADGAAPGETATTAADTPASGSLDWFYTMLKLVPTVLSVGALGGLTSGAVDLFKMFGVGREKLDGQMGKVTAVLNLAVYVGVVIANLFGYGAQLAGFFEKFGPALPSLVALITMFGGSWLTHKLAKLFDNKSFSFTAQVRPG